MNRFLVIIGIFLVGTAVAIAAIPHSSTNIITGCYNTGLGIQEKGSLRVIDKESGEVCKSNETELEWNQTGPQGPIGPSNGYIAKSNTVLTPTGTETVFGAYGVVNDLNLSAGSYLIWAKARLTINPITNEVECVLNDGTNDIDRVINIVASSPLNETEPRGDISSLMGSVVFNSSGTVVWKCRAKGTGIIAHPVLTAIKIGTLETQ